MKLPAILAQVSDHLLQQPPPNLFFHNISLLCGLVLLIAWVVYSSRLKVKRFSMVFWLGLAFSALAGPFLGGLFQ